LGWIVKYVVTEAHATEYPDPIAVRQGEKVIVEIEHDDEWPNWFFCKKLDGSNGGWIPEQIIRKQKTHGLITEDYSARELSVRKERTVNGFRELNGWVWCECESAHETGWVPLKNLKRKGARTIKEIPNEVLERLNRGEIETANLVEWLAIDRRVLLENLLAGHGRKKYLRPILKKVDGLEKQTTITVAEAIGAGLYEQVSANGDDDFFRAISTHRSDFVRSWAADVVGRNIEQGIGQMLLGIKPFAADGHFNVRESAWSSARLGIIRNLRESLAILSAWAKDADENVRRFASEATRPRGVWCEHIVELKQTPELGLPILEPLKSDESNYVRLSVGNWLNDASKSAPEFVRRLCERWEQESDTKETRHIVKRALRTLAKSD